MRLLTVAKKNKACFENVNIRFMTVVHLRERGTSKKKLHVNERKSKQIVFDFSMRAWCEPVGPQSLFAQIQIQMLLRPISSSFILNGILVHYFSCWERADLLALVCDV